MSHEYDKHSENHLPSKLAIGLGIAGIVAYESFAPKGELISEQVDRYRETKIGRFVVPLLISTVALHLLRAIPPKYDWVHRLANG